MNEQDDTTYEPVDLDLEVEDAVPVQEPAQVIEAEPEPEPMPEPVVEPEPVVIIEEPVAVAQPEPVAPPTPAPQPQPIAKPARHVVTNGDADPVRLSACVYENKNARKSLTVHHVQRRLTDLGYNDAVGDRDGWYGELTALAVKAFQKDKGLVSTGLMDEATFTKLFQGDTNVEVILS
jgi:peptidoglycan hydrolase-like protein with peptidoglycan-binding domain